MKTRLGERRAALSESDRDLLDHAAIIGYRFDLVPLGLALGTGIAPLLDGLERCRAATFVVYEDVMRCRWRFRHALVHQACADALDQARAAACHARILTVFESLPESAERTDRLAYHARACGDPARALFHNERAGEAALAMRTLPEARRYFQFALEAAQDEFERKRLSAKLQIVQRELPA